MSKPIEITLNHLEVMWASQVGSLRHTEALKKNLKDQHGFKGDPLMIHINGACGEIAVAKGLGKYWGGSVNTFRKENDVGKWEVRTRSKEEYDLLIRPNDSDENIYVLVVGQIPTYKVVGWMRARDAKQEKWLRDYGGRPPAYFVPKEELFDLEMLK